MLNENSMLRVALLAITAVAVRIVHILSGSALLFVSGYYAWVFASLL